jgi:hypothetical protein
MIMPRKNELIVDKRRKQAMKFHTFPIFYLPSSFFLPFLLFSENVFFHWIMRKHDAERRQKKKVHTILLHSINLML